MSKSKSKSKSKRPTVRGPQLSMVGPVATKQGNALIAFRCPQAVVDAFVAKHGGTASAWVALRKHMTGAVRK